MNCWEFKKCGWEGGGHNAVKFGACPAYPHFGRHCARIEHTLCNGVAENSFSQKLTRCIKCSFYNSPFYDKSYLGFRIDLILPRFARCTTDLFPNGKSPEQST